MHTFTTLPTTAHEITGINLYRDRFDFHFFDYPSIKIIVLFSINRNRLDLSQLFELTRPRGCETRRSINNHNSE